jgi:hypothetical protein
MRKLLRGLHSDPASYDSHPLAAREFTDVLTANLEVPVPPELRPREIGAWEIVRALGLLTLDGLQSQLSQSEPDEQLTLGLIIAWSKDIQPLVDGVSDKFPSYKQIISEYRSLTTLGNLLGELPQVADWPITQFKWITGTFSKMYGSATGERKAGYYREDALRYLLRRIERAAASASSLRF